MDLYTRKSIHKGALLRGAASQFSGAQGFVVIWRSRVRSRPPRPPIFFFASLAILATRNYSDGFICPLFQGYRKLAPWESRFDGRAAIRPQEATFRWPTFRFCGPQARRLVRVHACARGVRAGAGRPPACARARPLSSGVADCLCREKNKCASSRINQTQSAFACKSRSHLACPPHPPFAPPAHPADPRRKGAHSVFNTTIELIQNQTTLTFVFEHGNFRTRARVQLIAVLPRAPPSRICLMSTTRCAGNENSHCLADTFSRARRKRPGASARA